MAEGCFQVAYLNASENQHFLIVRKARPFLINSLFYPIFWSARWLKYVIQYFCNCYGIYFIILYSPACIGVSFALIVSGRILDIGSL